LPQLGKAHLIRVVQSLLAPLVPPAGASTLVGNHLFKSILYTLFMFTIGNAILHMISGDREHKAPELHLSRICVF